jgi:hypothetical protein
VTWSTNKAQKIQKTKKTKTKNKNNSKTSPVYKVGGNQQKGDVGEKTAREI